MIRRPLRTLLGALAWSAICSGICQAGVLQYCDAPAARTAEQKDRLLRFSAVIRTELEASGAGVALIARSGLDLSSMGVRYSHAGLSLKANPNAAWSVRQLYYACDEGKPRIFDQGLSAFLFGLADPTNGYISVVLLPAADAAPLEAAALDNTKVLQLLNPRYSANAYPFSQRYQNCNQWLMELLASAWGRLNPDGDLRAQAQRWLQDKGYSPTEFKAAWQPVFWITAFSPFLNLDDHPPETLADRRMRVSMPASIESFVRSQTLGATRIEFCHTARHVVIRRGWQPIAEGCTPSPQDTVVALD